MIRHLARPLLLLLIVLLSWQVLVVIRQVPPYLLPSPYAVLLTLYQQAPLLLTESLPTLFEMLVGLLLAILLGSLAATALALSRGLARYLLPFVLVSQALPTFAIAPLFVVWFGFGLSSKIAITVLMLFFPVASNFYDGLVNFPADYALLAKSMRATPWRLFWHLKLPHALPQLASGIRLAAVGAPLGAIVGEWVGAAHGLGYLMLYAQARMEMDLVFAILILIIGLSLSLYYTVDYLLKRWISWH